MIVRSINIGGLARLVMLLVLMTGLLPLPAAADESPLAITAEQPAPTITVPHGFAATMVIRLPEQKQPTSIAYGPDGALYIAVLNGEIYRLTDDGALTQFAGPYALPIGLVWRGSDLYVSSLTPDKQRGQVAIVRDTDGDHKADDLKVVLPDMPVGVRARHLVNGLAFGLDDKLYVTNGTLDNRMPTTDDERRGTIQRYNPDGTIPRDNPNPRSPVIATGVRNPYDVAVHPVDGTVFITDNGRDDLGDEEPPDELNHIIFGRAYGWPECYGINRGSECQGTQPPIAELEPHATAAGLTFYTGDQFGAEYKHDLFIALYGAGGDFTKRPYGRKVQHVELTRRGETYDAKVTTFAVGFERPLDVITAKNGGLLVADFGNIGGTGSIYRIDRRPDANPFAPVPDSFGDDAPVYMPATGHTVAADFYDLWRENGGLEMFGYPISQEFMEDGVVVQYFERARFERHITERRPEWRVLLGLLGRTVTAGRESEPPFRGIDAFPDSDDRRYFPETGHSLAGGFKRYWDERGGARSFGLPITEEFTERNPDTGQEYTVQYFERARFEYHPEHAGTPYEVLLGRLGAQVAAWRYQLVMNPAASTALTRGVPAISMR